MVEGRRKSGCCQAKSPLANPLFHATLTRKAKAIPVCLSLQRVPGRLFSLRPPASLWKCQTHPDSGLPADPEVAPGQEAGHRVPGQMVDPPFLPQLGHDCIDPREACLALCPLCQGFRVPVPGDLDADGVPLHTIELRVVCGCCVEKLPPQKLPIQREGWRAVSLYLWRRKQGYSQAGEDWLHEAEL